MDSSDTQATGANPEGKAPTLDIAKLIGRYVQLRDRKAELVAKHKEQLKPFNDLMDEIGGKLLAHMQDMGVSSVSSPLGSAYQTTTPSATVRDGSAFRQWVVANQQFGLVDWRANAPAVFEYIKEHGGALPPGLNTSTYTKVGVRRPNEKE